MSTGLLVDGCVLCLCLSPSLCLSLSLSLSFFLCLAVSLFSLYISLYLYLCLCLYVYVIYPSLSLSLSLFLSLRRPLQRAHQPAAQVKTAYQTLQNPTQRENIIKLIKGARKGVEAKRAKLVAKGADEASLGPIDFAVEQATMTVFAQAEQRRRTALKNEVGGWMGVAEAGRQTHRQAGRQADRQTDTQVGWLQVQEPRLVLLHVNQTK